MQAIIMKTLLNSSQVRWNQILSKSLLVGTISAAGVFAGWMPGLPGHSPTLVFGTAAQAQDIGNEEITRYARAVLAMEPKRLEAYNEIKGMVGSVPPVVCNETKSINTLPGSLRVIAVNYCDQAKKIIETNGLTVARFNDITLNQKADPALKQRIQLELLRLQQSTDR